jgi:hypothetical protein
MAAAVDPPDLRGEVRRPDCDPNAPGVRCNSRTRGPDCVAGPRQRGAQRCRKLTLKNFRRREGVFDRSPR